MVDQNTDRMWYVIGAVIIGAAIIFILNGTMPQLFASVGDTFNSKAKETTAITDGITPQTRMNLLQYGEQEVRGGQQIGVDGSSMHKWGTEFLRHEDLAPIFDKNGLDDTYTLMFELKSQDTTQLDQITIYTQSGEGSKYTFANHRVTVTEEYQTFTITGLKPYLNQANLTLEKPFTTAHLAFYGTYKTGNIPVVRNVKLYKE